MNRNSLIRFISVSLFAALLAGVLPAPTGVAPYRRVAGRRRLAVRRRFPGRRREDRRGHRQRPRLGVVHASTRMTRRAERLTRPNGQAGRMKG